MEQVGYDMYCRLLDEVMKEMQSEKAGKSIETQNTENEDIQIDLNVSSYIPEEYIESSNIKIEVYQNIALSRNEEEILDITDEIIDRFGSMPKEVENLLEIARIKNMCREKGINKIIQRNKNAIFYFSPNNFNLDNMDKLINEYKNNIKFSPSAIPYITYTIDLNKSVIRQVKEFLNICKW